MNTQRTILPLFLSVFFALSLGLSSCSEESTDRETTDSKPTVTKASASTPPPSGDVKFAYVNTDTLSVQYEMIKDLEDELLEERMNLEGQLQAMMRDYEKDYTDAQQGAQGLSQEALAILQQKLMQKEQNIMQQRDRMEGQLLRLEQEKTDLYLDAVHTFLEKYAEDNGYQIIYGYNGLANLLYIDPVYDITDDVLAELNASYANSKEEVSLDGAE